MTNIGTIIGRLETGRKVQGIAAALLPFEAEGRIAVEAFQNHLRATQRAGLMNAVNMDTGYVNYLGEAEKLAVLQWTRDALGKATPFVAGAYIEGLDGDIVFLYRKQMDTILVSEEFRFSSRRAVCMEHRPRRKQRFIRMRAGATRTYWHSSWAGCSLRTAKSLKTKCSSGCSISPKSKD